MYHVWLKISRAIKRSQVLGIVSAPITPMVESTNTHTRSAYIDIVVYLHVYIVGTTHTWKLGGLLAPLFGAFRFRSLSWDKVSNNARALPVMWPAAMPAGTLFRNLSADYRDIGAVSRSLVDVLAFYWQVMSDRVFFAT